MEKKRSLEDELFYIGLAVFPIGMVAIWIYYKMIELLPVIPCFFNTLFGMYCPGCGGTRAFNALLQGKFLKSFWYHPLVPYSIIIYLGFMITNGLHKLGLKRLNGWKFHMWYIWSALGILVFNFILKNILRLGFGILM